MNIHEYQAKALFAQYQIPVPKGTVVESLEEVERLVMALNDRKMSVIKAQVHAGARLKGGGVKFAKDPSEIRAAAYALLGKKLVTPECPAGRMVNKLLIEEWIAGAQELYLSLLVDRSKASILLTASAHGGIEIEKVAKENSTTIFQSSLDPVFGYRIYQGREIALRLGLPAEIIGKWTALLGNLYRLFVEKNALQIEINPLVLTTQNDFMALDAKVVFDDNALYGQPEIHALRDYTQEDPTTAKAAQMGFYYMKLDGSVGCMVNGGGLAMSTMDLLTRAGARPANFMDLGGGAPKERIKSAFQFLLEDSRVKSVFINVFGGLSQCNRIADGVMAAVFEKPDIRQVMQSIPVVVRFEGTHAQEAKAMLRESGIPFIVVDSLKEGVQRLMAEIKGHPERKNEKTV